MVLDEYDEYEMNLLYIAAEVADNGDAEALFRLGKAHMNSYSKEHYNPEKAEKLLRKATELGHIGAEAMLGSWLLDNGNHDEGVRLLTEAAENGDSSAQSKLGTYYRFRNDYEQAVKWLEKAGKHDEYAYYQLSLCYEEGHGVKKDIRKAKKMWEELSAHTPYGDAELGSLYLNGEGGFKKITTRRLNTSLAVSSNMTPVISSTSLSFTTKADMVYLRISKTLTSATSSSTSSFQKGIHSVSTSTTK